MITTYPTCRTAHLRNLRPLSTLGASIFLRNLGMPVHVGIMGNLRLLGNWLVNIIDDTKPVVVDDSPYAGALGTAIAAFDASQPFGEHGNSWSLGLKRRRSRGVVSP